MKGTVPDTRDCATQRACRRHGIQRWPRRQLLKLSKAIDQINATGSVKGGDGGASNPGTRCTFYVMYGHICAA